MANTRKPKKGQAKPAVKPIEDAVVIEEKARIPAETSGATKRSGATSRKPDPVEPSKTSKTPVTKAEKAAPAHKKASDAPASLGAKAGGESGTPSEKPTAKSAVAGKDPAAKSSVPNAGGSVSKAPETQSDSSAGPKPTGAKKNASEKGESTTESANTKTPRPQSHAAEPKPTRRSGVLVLLLGGLLAGAIGFAAARYPDQWPFVTTTAEDPVATALAAQSDRLAALEAELAKQAGAVTALQTDDSLNVARGEISGEFSQLRTQLEAMSGLLDDLENRLHTVEKLPQGSGMEAAAAAASAYERELQQMRQMLDAELAQITAAKEDAATLKENAAEAAKAAGARAALARVLAALDTGRPYGDALFDVTQQAGVVAPPALIQHAEAGVSTLAVLQSSFPEAARAALDAAIRASVENGEMDRVSAFFRLQLGTRSLSPKEGTDPDAILSRAEAALKSGQLDAALVELQSMPEAGQPAMQDWITSATARRDALVAGDALAQLVNNK